MTAKRDPNASQYLHLDPDGHMRLHLHVELEPAAGGIVHMHHELGFDTYGDDSFWLGADGTKHHILPQLLELHEAEPKAPLSERALKFAGRSTVEVDV